MKQVLSGIIFSVYLLLVACASQPDIPARSKAEIQKSVDSYTQLGFAYLERQNLERAKRSFVKALTINDDAPNALHGMALIYQQEGENQLAERYFRQALSQDKQFSVARNNFAAFLYANARYDEACQQLRQTVSDTLYLNRQLAFENLGLCEQQRGRLEQADSAFQRALQLNKQSARTLLELAHIKQLQNKPLDSWDYLQRHWKVAKATERSLRLGIHLAEILGKRADGNRMAAELTRLKQ